MAGAGEACSQIAALLYTVMTGVRIQQETAVTSERCQWLEATGPVGDIVLESQYDCLPFRLLLVLLKTFNLSSLNIQRNCVIIDQHQML